MEIYVGIDVAKETHWACALDARAQVLLDRAVDNDQAAIGRLVADLRALDGEVVLGADLPEVAGAGNRRAIFLEAAQRLVNSVISLPVHAVPLPCRIIAGKYRFARALKKYGSSGALRGRRALTGTIH